MIENIIDLHRRSFNLKESVCTIISDKPHALKIAEEAIYSQRKIIEDFIKREPHFQNSLDPLNLENQSDVVSLMNEAGWNAGVGPMASVAGVLADLSVKAMIEDGADVAIVENGGEASIYTDRPIHIALAFGEEALSRRIGFKIQTSPIGVATSSGKYSHALSFGEADAVTVFGETACIADAAATAAANLVKGEDETNAIVKGINKAMSIKGVSSALIVYGDKIGCGGELPTLIGIKTPGRQMSYG
ncbi:MAG: UPF0280 family protein [Candidatus Bathyarchaeia archaeon]